MFMRISGTNWWPPASLVRRSPLSTMPIPKRKRRSCSARCGPARSASCLAPRRRWARGTNVQDRLVAVHHLDVGWRPADMRLEDQLLKYFPAEIEAQQSRNRGYEADIRTVEAHPLPEEGFVGMEIGGRHYAEKADASDAILALCKEIKSTEGIPIGSYRGFAMELSYDTFEKQFQTTLKGGMSHRVSLGMDARGNLTRLDNALADIPARLERGRGSWRTSAASRPPHRWNWQNRSRRRRSLPKRARGLRS